MKKLLLIIPVMVLMFSMSVFAYGHSKIMAQTGDIMEKTINKTTNLIDGPVNTIRGTENGNLIILGILVVIAVLIIWKLPKTVGVLIALAVILLLGLAILNTFDSSPIEALKVLTNTS